MVKNEEDDTKLIICPVCGKRFIVQYGSIYKIKKGKAKHIVNLCSYTCFRKAGGGRGYI